MSAVKRSRTRRSLRVSVLVWLGLVWLMAIAAHASDNSKSTLEVFALLAESGSRPISNTPPPPINIAPKLQSWQAVQQKISALLQQIAADQQVLADQQAALPAAQSELAFWQKQDAENPVLSQGDTNVPLWTEAVASDQHLLATVQAQIAQLQAQIAAIQLAQGQPGLK